ncbi:Uncharacterized protein M6B38_110910 [Iris pallida]|uniref:Uncharacterized protein n=1 Tax=Iris pallida TaxID=29817 RepID=A0AAX6DZF1_IRIPA|nr:Uncharacterized protein M6B38_110910 [Iris pallida]
MYRVGRSKAHQDTPIQVPCPFRSAPPPPPPPPKARLCMFWVLWTFFLQFLVGFLVFFELPRTRRPPPPPPQGSIMHVLGFMDFFSAIFSRFFGFF